MQVGKYIEGQSMNVDELVSSLSASVENDRDGVQNAIKNVIFSEATRKSYSHDKRTIRLVLC